MFHHHVQCSLSHFLIPLRFVFTLMRNWDSWKRKDLIVHAFRRRPMLCHLQTQIKVISLELVSTSLCRIRTLIVGVSSVFGTAEWWWWLKERSVLVYDSIDETLENLKTGSDASMWMWELPTIPINQSKAISIAECSSHALRRIL